MELNISYSSTLHNKTDEIDDQKLEERKKSFKPTCTLSRLIIQENYANKLRKQRKCELYSFKRAKFMMPETTPIPSNSILNSSNKPTIEDLHFICQAITNPIDQALILPLLQKLRILLCGRQDHTKILEKYNIVPKLIQLLDYLCEKIQYESLWILINMTAMNYSHQVFSLGGHVKLVNLLGANDSVKEVAIWVLGNMAGESEELRKELLRVGVLEKVVELFKEGSNKLKLVKTACWTIRNLFKGQEPPSTKVITPFVKLLSFLISSKEDKEVEIGLEGLFGITMNINVDTTHVVDKINVKALINCANRKEASIRNKALQIIGNICLGESNDIKKLIENGLVTVISNVLKNVKDKKVLEEVCWFTSNIALGPTNHIQYLIDGFIFHSLAKLVLDSSDNRQDAAFALINGCMQGSELQKVQICSAGGLEAFAYLLRMENAKLLMAVLEVLDEILCIGDEENNALTKQLDELDGVSKLEQLQFHPNCDIINKAQQLLDKYFETYPLFQDNKQDDVEMKDMKSDREESQSEDD